MEEQEDKLEHILGDLQFNILSAQVMVTQLRSVLKKQKIKPSTPFSPAKELLVKLQEAKFWQEEFQNQLIEKQVVDPKEVVRYFEETYKDYIEVVDPSSVDSFGEPEGTIN